MLETLLPVIVGGLIGIAGGVGQALVNSKNEIKHHHLMKREESYLEFIKALLEIEVDYQYDEVCPHAFWPTFHAAQAKLNLYGSKKIVQLTQEFQYHLQDCWETHRDKGTEAKKWELVDAIRKELQIEK